MFNSGILDVAIGLVFIYLLLSLICTAINEMIEARLKIRAANLEQGIRELLQDPHGKGLTKKIYDHPLVFGLFKGNYGPTKIAKWWPITKWRFFIGSDLPSYIPSRNFALALMDIVLPGKQPEPGIAAETEERATLSGAAGAMVAPPAEPPAAASPAPPGGGAPPPSLQPLREAIPSLKNPHVEQALMTLVDAAGNDIGQARKNIEDWFDSGMDRITGWYKRRSQKIILVLGLLVAIAVNADTITIATSLSHDVAMRDSLVAAASEYAKADRAAKKDAPTTPKPGAPTPPEAVQAPAPTGALSITPAGGSATAPEGKPKSDKKEEPAKEKSTEEKPKVGENLAKILGNLKSHGLPMGWNWEDERVVPPWSGAWFFKVIGWLLTAAAISLGAPFWFDLLNKFITARSTLKPEKSSGSS